LPAICCQRHAVFGLAVCPW